MATKKALQKIRPMFISYSGSSPVFECIANLSAYSGQFE